MIGKHSLQIWTSIFLTFLIAINLSLLQLPIELFWLKPNWVTLVFIYWVIFLPNTIGILSGFSIGLLLDLLENNLLGSMGLTLTIIAFITNILRIRIRQLRFWQQIFIVFILVGFEKLMRCWTQLTVEHSTINLSHLVSTFINIGMWPVLSTILQFYQRSLKLI